MDNIDLKFVYQTDAGTECLSAKDHIYLHGGDGRMLKDVSTGRVLSREQWTGRVEVPSGQVVDATPQEIRRQLKRLGWVGPELTRLAGLCSA